MRDITRLLAFALPALAACAHAPAVTDAETAGFQQAAAAFQQQYTGGGENCATIMRAVAEDVMLVENGEAWGYTQLEQFCPHLPSKKVVESWSDRTLLDSGLGYDFVALVYENEPGARRRETTVRVWRKAADEWKVIRMSSVLSAVPTDDPGARP